MTVRVLLVDDSVDQAAALAELMSDDGIVVSIAHSGAHALRELAEHPPDAIVADLDLPDGDGLSVIRAARARRVDLCAVILTGYPRTHPLVRAAAAEDVAYRRKPVDVRELVALVTR